MPSLPCFSPAEPAAGSDRPAAPPTVPVVSVDGLDVAYNDTAVLQDVRFAVGSREIFVVLAPGAAGKSVLFRHLLALEPPPPGAIRLFGQDLGALSGRRLTELRRRIGAVHQQGGLFSALTVRENVRLPMAELTDLPPSTTDVMVDLKLMRLGLHAAADRLPAELSAAQVQRAAVARALALDPDLLICDDIVSGLDRQALDEIKQLVREVRDAFNLTVVLMMPHGEVAMALADRIAVLDAGRLIGCGAPDELAASGEPRIRQILLGEQGEAAGPGLAGLFAPLGAPG